MKPFAEYDDALSPRRALKPPDPVTIDGHGEFFVDNVVDQRRRGRGLQYRVLA